MKQTQQYSGVMERSDNYLLGCFQQMSALSFAGAEAGSREKAYQVV